MTAFVENPADYASTVAYVAVDPGQATIGVEPFTGELDEFWYSGHGHLFAGKHAIVRRREGKAVSIFSAVGTVAELDELARSIAPTWCARYVEPVIAAVKA